MRRKPRIWATWLAKAISGDAQCLWAVWYRSTRFQYEKLPDKNESALAVWSVDHGRQVTQRVDILRREEYSQVLVERENEFELEGRTATVAGKPDVVGVRSEYAAVIFDEKTGHPKPADVVQVALYVYAFDRLFPGRVHTGVVSYRDYPEIVVPPLDVKALGDMVAKIYPDGAPQTTPSHSECRYCNIAACKDRVTEPTQVATSDF